MKFNRWKTIWFNVGYLKIVQFSCFLYLSSSSTSSIIVSLIWKNPRIWRCRGQCWIILTIDFSLYWDIWWWENINNYLIKWPMTNNFGLWLQMCLNSCDCLCDLVAKGLLTDGMNLPLTLPISKLALYLLKICLIISYVIKKGWLLLDWY